MFCRRFPRFRDVYTAFLISRFLPLISEINVYVYWWDCKIAGEPKRAPRRPNLHGHGQWHLLNCLAGFNCIILFFQLVCMAPERRPWCLVFSLVYMRSTIALIHLDRILPSKIITVVTSLSKSRSSTLKSTRRLVKCARERERERERENRPITPDDAKEI